MSNSDQSHESHADGIVEAGQKAPIYFYLLLFGLVAWGVIFMAYYLFSGWSSAGEFADKMAAHTASYNQSAAAPAPASSAAGADSKQLFADNCAGCHGADGTGGFGSDLTRESFKYGKSEADLRTSILQGRGGKMPGFDGALNAAETDALIDFIEHL